MMNRKKTLHIYLKKKINKYKNCKKYLKELLIIKVKEETSILIGVFHKAIVKILQEKSYHISILRANLR